VAYETDRERKRELELEVVATVVVACRNIVVHSWLVGLFYRYGSSLKCSYVFAHCGLLPL
jgi:hypothetical protein